MGGGGEYFKFFLQKKKRVWNLLFQTLGAIAVMQNEEICHWDLHFNNILLSLSDSSDRDSSDRKTAFKWKNKVYWHDTTAKYIIKIIDFGRAQQFAKRNVSNNDLMRPIDAEDDNGNACTWKYPTQYCSATDVFSCLYWFWVFYFRKNSDPEFVSMFLRAFHFNKKDIVEHSNQIIQVRPVVDATVRHQLVQKVGMTQDQVTQTLNLILKVTK